MPISDTFFYFYGLVRRLFIDGPKGEVSEEERNAITEEARRLLAIYGGKRFFQRYVNHFPVMEWALCRSDKPAPDYLDALILRKFWSQSRFPSRRTPESDRLLGHGLAG